MTLKAMTIIILTKVPLLTTSPQSRSCQLPHWRQWWRGNSTGCLSSGWAWEGRLAITISKTCLTNHSVFNQPHPSEIFNKFKMPKKQLLEKCSIWPIWNYSQWNSETWWSSLRSICKASSSGFLLIQLRFNMLCISIGVCYILNTIYYILYTIYWDLTCCALVLEWNLTCTLVLKWDLAYCALVLEWGWPAYDCCHQGQ